jgi:hypothetical protein
VATYGAGSWTSTKDIAKQLAAFVKEDSRRNYYNKVKELKQMKSGEGDILKN